MENNNPNSQTTETAPFQAVLSDLYSSATSAVNEWAVANDKEAPLIYRDWALQAVQIITDQLSDPRHSVDIISDLIRNMLNQQQEQQKGTLAKGFGMKQVQNMHVKVVNQVSDFLQTYMNQKLNLERSATTISTWITESEQEVQRIQKSVRKMQENLVQRSGAMTLDEIRETPLQQSFNSISNTPGLDQSFSSQYGTILQNLKHDFQDKQDAVTRHFDQALNNLTLDQEQRSLMRSTMGQVQKRLVSSRKELLIENATNKPSRPFHFQSYDNPIASFKIHYSSVVAGGVNGIQCNLTDGKYTQIFGKEGYSKPISQYLYIPQGIQCVRIQTDGVYIAAIELLGQGQAQPDNKVVCLEGNHMQWKDFRLDHNEVIIGVYGEAFDYNYGLFKEFGFIIGKEE